MVQQRALGYKEIPIGGVCFRQATDYHTGDWKASRPQKDDEKCTRCMICYIFCPESCISYNEKEDRVAIDLNYCKGCGICAAECPAKAIQMVVV